MKNKIILLLSLIVMFNGTVYSAPYLFNNTSFSARVTINYGWSCDTSGNVDCQAADNPFTFILPPKQNIDIAGKTGVSRGGKRSCDMVACSISASIILSDGTEIDTGAKLSGPFKADVTITTTIPTGLKPGTITLK